MQLRINPKNPIALEGLSRLGEPLPVVAPVIEEAQQNLKQTEEVPPYYKRRPTVSVVKIRDSRVIDHRTGAAGLECKRQASALGSKKPRKDKSTADHTSDRSIDHPGGGLPGFVLPRIIRQAFPAASHFNENTQAMIQEVDLLDGDQ